MSERFAVLEHDWPTPHRDLLLQSGGVLRAWRLPARFDPLEPIPAEANFDHRLLYLDYEGPLTGDRGSVYRWDSGPMEWLEVREDMLRVRLHGKHLNGEFLLKQIDGTRWVLTSASATDLSSAAAT